MKAKPLEKFTKKELIEYIDSIRPKADCYDRVCINFNIKNNVTGFIENLQEQISDLQTELHTIRSLYDLLKEKTIDSESLVEVLKAKTDTIYLYDGGGDEDFVTYFVDSANCGKHDFIEMLCTEIFDKTKEK